MATFWGEDDSMSILSLWEEKVSKAKRKRSENICRVQVSAIERMAHAALVERLAYGEKNWLKKFFRITLEEGEILHIESERKVKDAGFIPDIVIYKRKLGNAAGEKVNLEIKVWSNLTKKQKEHIDEIDYLIVPESQFDHFKSLRKGKRGSPLIPEARILKIDDLLKGSMFIDVMYSIAKVAYGYELAEALISFKESRNKWSSEASILRGVLSTQYDKLKNKFERVGWKDDDKWNVKVEQYRSTRFGYILYNENQVCDKKCSKECKKERKLWIGFVKERGQNFDFRIEYKGAFEWAINKELEDESFLRGNKYLKEGLKIELDGKSLYDFDYIGQSDIVRTIGKITEMLREQCACQS